MTVAPKDLSDSLLSEGRFSFSLQEAQERLGLSERSARRAVERQVAAGRVFWAGRGLYVAIPPEFRRWGAIPASHFIDELMRSLGRRYYVALLSAAEIHGASHQEPQVFQAMVDRPVRNRDFGRVRLRFITGSHLGDVEPERHNTPTGTMLVSDRELTAVDLVAFPQHAGGLSNTATILIELGEMDGGMLAHYAASRPRAVARRLGWLLERFAADAADLRALRAAALPRHGEATLLTGGGRRSGPVESAWGIRVNTQVEPDGGGESGGRGPSRSYSHPYGPPPPHRGELSEQPRDPPSGHEDVGPPGFPDLADLAALNEAIHEAAGQLERFRLDQRAPLYSVLDRARAVYAPADEGVIRAAALLAHDIAQAQAFRDGNRRTAYWTAHFLLKANGLGHLMPSSDHMVARFLNQVVENPSRGRQGPSPEVLVTLFSRRLKRRNRPPA